MVITWKTEKYPNISRVLNIILTLQFGPNFNNNRLFI